MHDALDEAFIRQPPVAFELVEQGFERFGFLDERHQLARQLRPAVLPTRQIAQRATLQRTLRALAGFGVRAPAVCGGFESSGYRPILPARVDSMLDSGTHCSKGSKGSASSKGSVKAGSVEGAGLVDFTSRGFSSVCSSNARARSSRLLRAASDAASVGGNAASLSGDIPLLGADDASLCANIAVLGGDADSLDGALFAECARRMPRVVRLSEARRDHLAALRSRSGKTSPLVTPRTQAPRHAKPAPKHDAPTRIAPRRRVPFCAPSHSHPSMRRPLRCFVRASLASRSAPSAASSTEPSGLRSSSRRASPPTFDPNRLLRIMACSLDGDPSAYSSSPATATPGTTASAIALTPSDSRILFSISRAMSGFSRRNSRALSLPWPIRSPL